MVPVVASRRSNMKPELNSLKWSSPFTVQLISSYPIFSPFLINQPRTNFTWRINKKPMYLPGHPWVLQVFVCWDGPVQCLPPLEGAGLSQALVRYREPPSQVLVHWLYCPHGDQWPLTGEKSIIISHLRLLSWDLERWWSNDGKKMENAIFILHSKKKETSFHNCVQWKPLAVFSKPSRFLFFDKF